MPDRQLVLIDGDSVSLCRDKIPFGAEESWFFDQLAQQLVTEPPLEVVYLCSSSELLPLASLRRGMPLIDHLYRMFPDQEIRAVAQGCLGWYATINDFFHSVYHSALILVCELLEKCQQDCLNALGIGAYDGNPGFVAHGGAAFVRLRKVDAGPNWVGRRVLTAAQVLLQGEGLMGIRQLIDVTSREIQRIAGEGPARVVSFAVKHRYSDILLKALTARLPVALAPAKWLPSIEDRNEVHYLTLKPLLELERYSASLLEGPLIITSLGVGGKFGLLKVENYSSETSLDLFTQIDEVADYFWPNDYRCCETYCSFTDTSKSYPFIVSFSKTSNEPNAAYYRWKNIGGMDNG